jgi:hypothetical protein
MMNRKVFGRHRSSSNRGILQAHAWRNYWNHKHLYQDNRCPGRDRNQVPVHYENRSLLRLYPVRPFLLYKSTIFFFLSDLKRKLAYWLWLSSRTIAALNKAYCLIMFFRRSQLPRGPPSPPCWRHYHVIIFLSRYRAECMHWGTENTKIPFSLTLQALSNVMYV